MGPVLVVGEAARLIPHGLRIPVQAVELVEAMDGEDGLVLADETSLVGNFSHNNQ
jgi:hypothetical protein